MNAHHRVTKDTELGTEKDMNAHITELNKYKGVHLECGYRIDTVVAGQIVVECKSVEVLAPIHDAQLLTYLRLGGYKLGLLINFNVVLLKDGIHRRIM